MNVPNKPFEAFAMLVDINGFASAVRKGGDLIAQFTRDSLAGCIDAVEKEDGDVVSFMGDGLLAILPSAAATLSACGRIAKDIDQSCEWIGPRQQEHPDSWDFAPGGFGVKVAVEYGWFDVSDVQSRFLGKQRLFVAEPINYASRISAAGEGNRCLIGPYAADRMRDIVALNGPVSFIGKHSEKFEYFELDLGDVWVAGSRPPEEDSYLG